MSFSDQDDVSDPFADPVGNVNPTESLQEAENAPGRYQQVAKQPSNRETHQQSIPRQESNESYSQGWYNHCLIAVLNCLCKHFYNIDIYACKADI